MKVKELIELLKQTDPEQEVAIEYCDIDEYNCCYKTRHVSVNPDDCKSEDNLFMINIEAHQ